MENIGGNMWVKILFSDKEQPKSKVHHFHVGCIFQQYEIINIKKKYSQVSSKLLTHNGVYGKKTSWLI